MDGRIRNPQANGYGQPVDQFFIQTAQQKNLLSLSPCLPMALRPLVFSDDFPPPSFRPPPPPFPSSLASPSNPASIFHQLPNDLLERFQFCRRTLSLDWDIIRSVDFSSLIDGRDFPRLLALSDALIYCDLTDKDRPHLKPQAWINIFRLLQLVSEFLRFQVLAQASLAASERDEKILEKEKRRRLAQKLLRSSEEAEIAKREYKYAKKIIRAFERTRGMSEEIPIKEVCEEKETETVEILQCSHCPSEEFSSQVALFSHFALVHNVSAAAFASLQEENVQLKNSLRESQKKAEKRAKEASEAREREIAASSALAALQRLPAPQPSSCSCSSLLSSSVSSSDSWRRLYEARDAEFRQKCQEVERLENELAETLRRLHSDHQQIYQETINQEIQRARDAERLRIAQLENSLAQTNEENKEDLENSKTGRDRNSLETIDAPAILVEAPEEVFPDSPDEFPQPIGVAAPSIHSIALSGHVYSYPAFPSFPSLRSQFPHAPARLAEDFAVLQRWTERADSHSELQKALETLEATIDKEFGGAPEEFDWLEETLDRAAQAENFIKFEEISREREKRKSARKTKENSENRLEEEEIERELSFSSEDAEPQQFEGSQGFPSEPSENLSEPSQRRVSVDLTNPQQPLEEEENHQEEEYDDQGEDEEASDHHSSSDDSTEFSPPGPPAQGFSPPLSEGSAKISEESEEIEEIEEITPVPSSPPSSVRSSLSAVLSLADGNFPSAERQETPGAAHQEDENTGENPSEQETFSLSPQSFISNHEFPASSDSDGTLADEKSSSVASPLEAPEREKNQEKKSAAIITRQAESFQAAEKEDSAGPAENSNSLPAQPAFPVKSGRRSSQTFNQTKAAPLVLSSSSSSSSSTLAPSSSSSPLFGRRARRSAEPIEIPRQTEKVDEFL